VGEGTSDREGDGDWVVSDGFTEDFVDDCARDLDIDGVEGTTIGNSSLSTTFIGTGKSIAMVYGLVVTGIVEGLGMDSVIGSSTASITGSALGSAIGSEQSSGANSGRCSETDFETSSDTDSVD
jgi:hypothetical protein